MSLNENKVYRTSVDLVFVTVFFQVKGLMASAVYSLTLRSVEPIVTTLHSLSVRLSYSHGWTEPLASPGLSLK